MAGSEIGGRWPAKFGGRSAVAYGVLSDFFLQTVKTPSFARERRVKPMSCRTSSMTVLAHEDQGPSQAERLPPEHV